MDRQEKSFKDIPIKCIVSGRCLLFNRENKILLVSEDSGSWHVPGGWRSPLESIMDSCVRETYEEVGIIAEAKKVVFIQESIVDTIKSFDNILHRLDVYCLCICKDDTINESWLDPDDGMIKNRRFFSEDEWHGTEVLAPEELKMLSFSQISSMPNCYSWSLRIDETDLYELRKAKG